MKKLLLFYAFSLSIINCNAQQGTLDFNFNPGMGANSTVFQTPIQSDGRILIGGWFSTYNGTNRNKIARLNTNGSLDTTFNPGTGANDYLWTTTIQSDGKILLGGAFTIYNGTGRNHIARINTDGTLDTTFNIGTGANNFVFRTAIQSDGKIIVGGLFTTYNGIGRNGIARLNVDGTLDITFNPGTGVDNNEYVWSITIQNDGKIIIGGTFTTFNGIGRNGIARLNVDGTLDTTFNPGTADTGGNNLVHTISIQNDYKIIIGGNFTNYNSTSRNYLVRLNTDGTLDLGFNPAGAGANSSIFTTAIQSDGKIIIGGWFTNYNGIGRSSIARLNTDGTLDTNFNPGTGAINDNVIYTSNIQNDGKIMIGGKFTIYNGTGINRIARLNGNENVGITELNKAIEQDIITIYPNPANDKIIIVTPHRATIEMLDIEGQLIKTIVASSTATTIDIFDFARGIYFIKVTTDKGITVRKFIKE